MKKGGRLSQKWGDISLSNAVAQNDFEVFVSLFTSLKVKLHKNNKLFYLD